MEKKIRIIIVDSKTITRNALSSHLRSDDRFEIVGEITDNKELIGFLKKTQVEIVLMESPKLATNTRESLKTIRFRFPEVKVVILINDNNQQIIKEYISLGAKSLFSLDSEPLRLNEIILELQKNKFCFSKEVWEIIAEAYVSVTSDNKRKNDLTIRQQEILKRLDEGKTVKEIASNLHISINTVNYHKKQIYLKTNSHSLVQAINKAEAKW